MWVKISASTIKTAISPLRARRIARTSALSSGFVAASNGHECAGQRSQRARQVSSMATSEEIRTHSFCGSRRKWRMVVRRIAAGSGECNVTAAGIVTTYGSRTAKGSPIVTAAVVSESFHRKHKQVQGEFKIGDTSMCTIRFFRLP